MGEDTRRVGAHGSFVGRRALVGALARPTPGGRHGAACSAVPSMVDLGDGMRLRAESGWRTTPTESWLSRTPLRGW